MMRKRPQETDTYQASSTIRSYFILRRLSATASEVYLMFCNKLIYFSFPKEYCDAERKMAI